MKRRDLEILEQSIKAGLPQNTVVIFQTKQRYLKTLTNSLHAMVRTFARYGICPIACPDTVRVIVIPAGTNPDQVALARAVDEGVKH